jgi:chromosome segregation ATPase
MMVTNKLASLFIEENLKVRESLSEGTSEFIRRELQAAEENLKKKEQEIRNYNEKFMGKLPSQIDSNMRVLDGLDDRLNSVAGNIMDKERRSSSLQIQIEQLKRPKPAPIQVESSGDKQLDKEIKEIEEAMQQPEKTPDDPLINQYYTLKKDLTNAQINYTDRHPDVIALKSKIAQLEPKFYERMRGLEKQRQEKMELDKTRRERLQELKARRDKIIGANKGKVVGLDPETEKVLSRLTDQYDELQWEMKKLRTEEKELRNKMAVYQRKVEEVPKREEELASLMRDYDLFKSGYQSLLSKQMEAKMAENLEQKQQGEQFKILDPARLPEKPIRPKVEQILLMGIAIGLFAGIGLTWFRESLDQSFHSEADLEAHLGLPILAVIPNLKEEDKAIKT